MEGGNGGTTTWVTGLLYKRVAMASYWLFMYVHAGTVKKLDKPVPVQRGVLFRGIVRMTKTEMSAFDFEDTAGEISALTARHAR